MESALYDPVQGYYRKLHTVFGPEGDFLTAPRIHPIFSRVLARALAAFFGKLPVGPPLVLVELGAAEGDLGREVMDEINRLEASLASRIEYVPVEVGGGSIPNGFTGVILSNEFFDALPVHRVVVRGGQLRELWVTEKEGRITEFLGELSDPRIRDYMQETFPEWREGWCYEVNLKMLDVLDEIDAKLHAGFVLTFDYGLTWDEYNAMPRPDGTLATFRRHEFGSDPYVDPGSQDITAHVHLDAFLRKGRALGWVNQPLLTQRDFLMTWGLESLLQAEETEGGYSAEKINARLALKELLMPGGISDAIRAVVQKVRVSEAT